MNESDRDPFETLVGWDCQPSDQDATEGQKCEGSTLDGRSRASTEQTSNVAQQPSAESMFATIVPTEIAQANSLAQDTHQDGSGPRLSLSPPGPRFMVLRAHARGGLGQVSLAYDRELNRNVALKEILPERAGEVDSQRRFVQEAEITGQLEHPGIIPIYGLGINGDGQPYYAMRFVEGQNLQAAIKDFHAARSPHEKLLGQRAVQFRSLLGKFANICQAIEYAHSRSIIHRDLKPENILLGPYGETLVVDWGLAKSMAFDESEPAQPVASTCSPTNLPVRVRSNATPGTLDGSAVGTPAYMSPEQAEGRISELGPPTDIYSLGAILFAILSGRPPVSGKNALEKMERSRLGQLDSVFQHWTTVPRPLVSICHRALAKDPQQRYAAARDLAEDVENWLADEPVAAHRENWLERSDRFVRKHQTAVAGAVILTLATAIIVAIVTLFRSQLDSARNQKQMVEFERTAFEREASNQRFFADLNAVRERATKQIPGWSWQNQSELSRIAKEKHVLLPDSARMLREEFARLVTTVDVRRVKPIVNGIRVSAIGWSPNGAWVALGQRTATMTSLQVRLLDAITFQPIKTLSFVQSFGTLIANEDTDGIRTLVFSHDSKQLFVGTRAGEILQFDLQQFKLQHRWTAHKRNVNAILVSHDGSLLVTGDRDGELKWWRLSDRTLLKSERLVYGIRRLSANGTDRMFVFSDGIDEYPCAVEVLANPPKRIVAQIDTCVDLPGAGFVVSDSTGLRQHGFDGKLNRRMVTSQVGVGESGLDAGCAGRFIAESRNDSIDVWDALTGRKLAMLSGVEVAVASIDPNRPTLLVAQQDRVDYFELRIDPLWRNLPIHELAIASSGLVNSTESIWTATQHTSRPTAVVRSWKIDSQTPIDQNEIPNADAAQVAASRDGQHFAFLNRANYLLSEWDAKSKTVREWNDQPIYNERIVYSPNGDEIWYDSKPRRTSGLLPEKLDAWSLATLKRGSGTSKTLATNQFSALFQGFSHFLDLCVGQQYALSAIDNGISIWQVGNDSQSIPSPIDRGVPSKLAISPSERMGAAGMATGDLVLFDVATGKSVQTVAAHVSRISAVSFADDRLLFCGDAFGDISVWHCDNQRLELICRLAGFGNTIRWLQPVDSGRLIAIGVLGEPTVRLLDWHGLVQRWYELEFFSREENRELSASRN